MDDQNDVIDGEEVTTDASVDNSQASAMLNLEELIKNHIDSIDKLKDELKQAREMFEDSFSNNPTYREVSEQAKEAAKKKSQVRQQIAKQPSVAQLAQKVKDLRFDMGEQSKTLSDLLADYKEQTGATQIELRNGRVMEIVSTLRLVQKS